MKKIIKPFLCLSLFLGLTHQIHAVDTTGLVSFYPFTTSTTDDSSFANNFTAVNAPTLVTTNPAPRDSALQLVSASLQYLRLDHPNDNSVNGFPVYKAGAYTITMWVKGAAQTAKYLFTEANQTNATGGTTLLLLQTGNAAATNRFFDVNLRNDTGTTLINHKFSQKIVFDNTWHHIAFVDNNGAVSLYIDGLLDGNNSTFQYVRSGNFNFDRASIGCLVRNTGISTTATFNGAMDDVSFWERPLSQSEVQDLMTNSIPVPVAVRAPALLTQPLSQTKNVGDSAIFSVSAVNNRPFSYQWSKNGIAILDATNQTYRARNLTTNDSGSTFSVAVTNPGGTTTSSNAVVTVNADAAPNVTASLISYWPFDEVTNTPAMTPDLFSGNSMILNSMDSNNLVVGKFGSALNFVDGATQYTYRSGGFPIYGNPAYSVSLWVNSADLSPSRRIFSENSTNNNNPAFSIAADPSITPVLNVVITSDTGTTLLNKKTTSPILDGTWHHVVWVDNNGTSRLYVDGLLDDTDFTYTRGTVTLNTTAVAASLKAAVGNVFIGAVDEVATWNRALNFGEVQQIFTQSVPHPIAPTPVSITKQPTSTTVFTNSTVTLTGEATGTSPLYFQWLKNGTPVANETNSTFTIASAQVADSGTYSFSVSNVVNNVVSSNAVVTVVVRPPVPGSFGLDFNDRTATTNDTQLGFQSFILIGTGGTTASTTNVYGGIEVSLSSVGGVTLDTRKRTTPINSGSFTLEKIYQDFVFCNQTTGTNGLLVTLKYLTPNKNYDVTVYSYDSGSGVNPRRSDWYINGNLVQTNYAFDASIVPTTDAQNNFTVRAPADADGTIALMGVRNLDSTNQLGVFLNAVKIALPPIRILSIEVVSGKIRLTLDTPFAGSQNTVQETSNLTAPITWSAVTGVTFSVNGNTVIAEFNVPANGIHFYRISGN